MAELFAVDVPATTLTDLTGGGIASGKGGSYQLNLCNRGGEPRSFRVALTKNVTSSGVGLANYIEFDMQIEPSGVFSRWPIALDEGWKVWIYASGTGLSAVLVGLEDS